jgi:hypothetical protein
MGAPPKPMGTAERQRRVRQNSPDKASATRTKYRHDNSKHQTDAKYLSRQFVAWDGEGITDAFGIHRYVMIAVSDGEGKSYYLGNPKGLGTYELLTWMTDKAQRFPGAIHVIYGGGYDFNMILKDLKKAELWRAYKRPFFEWNGFRLGWRQGKSMHFAQVDDKGKTIPGYSFLMYDVVSFFQCAFVKACDDYLGDRFLNRELIVENKALRSSFTAADIPEVKRYNQAELQNLVALMVELRERLNAVGLRPRRWDGPGAIAAALMLREKIKEAKADCPPEVAQAARFAYAGGRFEMVKWGHSDKEVYEYDINSAYPAALRYVPNLANGYWRRVSDRDSSVTFGVYKVRSSADRLDIPAPLFRRGANGAVCYPLDTVGWYWAPEVDLLPDYAALGLTLSEPYPAVEWEILDGWEFIEDDASDKPFAFIETLFEKRRQLKREGNGAHVGIKLGLNSLYGKLCQQVGWGISDKGELRIPPFHQLEWAGYVTAYARATVMRAAMTNIEAIIAFETDAVFSSEPLDVPLGTALGEFELTTFANLTYVQSGLYFGDLADGGTVNKTRGVDRGTLTRAQVLEAMTRPLAADREVKATLTRFVGAGVALNQSWSRWRKWETVEKTMRIGPTGKREHNQCRECDDGKHGVKRGVWHVTFCPFMNAGASHEFPVEWINPNPDMDALSEMRREDHGYDDAV